MLSLNLNDNYTVNSMPIPGSYSHTYIYPFPEHKSNVANVISWFIFITVMVESIQMAFSDRYKYYTLTLYIVHLLCTYMVDIAIRYVDYDAFIHTSVWQSYAR